VICRYRVYCAANVTILEEYLSVKRHPRAVVKVYLADPPTTVQTLFSLTLSKQITPNNPASSAIKVGPASRSDCCSFLSFPPRFGYSRSYKHAPTAFGQQGMRHQEQTQPAPREPRLAWVSSCWPEQSTVVGFT
jgi:hypothetical protein